MLEMRRQDLEELNQLLTLYAQLYGSRHAQKLLEEVSERYGKNYGESISGKGNPRRAGRKRQYTEAEKSRIRKYREEGLTIREIAKETGCSVGYVQGVLSDPL